MIVTAHQSGDMVHVDQSNERERHERQGRQGFGSHNQPTIVFAEPSLYCLIRRNNNNQHHPSLSVEPISHGNNHMSKVMLTASHGTLPPDIVNGIGVSESAVVDDSHVGSMRPGKRQKRSW